MRNYAGYLLSAVFGCCAGVQHDGSIPFLFSIQPSRTIGCPRVSQYGAASKLQLQASDVELRCVNSGPATSDAEVSVGTSGIGVWRVSRLSQISTTVHCYVSSDMLEEVPKNSWRMQTLRLRGGKSKSEGQPRKTKDQVKKRKKSKTVTSLSTTQKEDDFGEGGHESPEVGESAEVSFSLQYEAQTDWQLLMHHLVADLRIEA